MQKVCNKCGETKPIEEFHRDKNRKDGRHLECKTCRAVVRIRKVKEDHHPGMKFCTGCQTWKPVEEFHLHKAGTKGKQNRCKACSIALAAAWRKGNPNYYSVRKERDPNYFRNAKLRKLYGITGEEYDALSARQHGVCAICGKPESRKLQGKTAPLSVDHDHITGKTRGLLCHACNIALAYVERTDWLNSAQEYLDEYRE